MKPAIFTRSLQRPFVPCVGNIHGHACQNRVYTQTSLAFTSRPPQWRSAVAVHSAAPSSPTSEAETAAQPEQSTVTYAVMNFYHLVDLPDPAATTALHRDFLNTRDIRGRIYITGQGINAQFSGPIKDTMEYYEFAKSQPGFERLRYNMDIVEQGQHLFPKLRLKHKRSLISMAGGTQQYRLSDPAARATPLEPSQWKDMLREAKEVIVASRGGEGAAASAAAAPAEPSKAEGAADPNYVVLDLRNSFEWDAGHFEGSDRPHEEMFHQTPTDGSLPSFLEGKDPESTNVMMYCTGGIRCDIYSTYLRQKGFKNLYTLEGGISNYIREEGGELWKGSLFVFDGRMAVPAARPTEKAEATGAGLPAAVGCQLCSAAQAELPHVNCANVDCNKLFIACPGCKQRLMGACCEECLDAPRLLRPPKVNGFYGSWFEYADQSEAARQEANRKMASGRRRTVVPAQGSDE